MNVFPKPLILAILDGFGLREEAEGNAILAAHPEHLEGWWREYPHARLDASGPSVGLPAGIMGNSEVGHMALGAGRIVFQGLSQIYQAIADGSFFSNPALERPMQIAKSTGATFHLLGLVSDGAVHSHQDHLYALLEMARREGLRQVAIHAFLDGRDTPPKSALRYLDALEKTCKEIGVGEIASVSGRYYAMDRDKRYDRTDKAYRAMVWGEGRKAHSAREAVEAAYARGETDEFVLPTVIIHDGVSLRTTLRDGDTALFFNFRPDRARQLTYALTQSQFDGFVRPVFPQLAAFSCMAEYERNLGLPVAFYKQKLSGILPEILAARGLKQLRIAETEKFAHVTYFFNGGEERVFPGEDRELIPSPREVATYDQKPEMSAVLVKEALLRRLAETPYDVVILNFANPDMVGHTGNLEAATQAVRAVDRVLAEIVPPVLEMGGALIVTSDHGNCEEMQDGSGGPHTAHTTNLVPFVLIDPTRKKAALRPLGRLGDIAPTMLEMLGIPKPPEMTGESLLVEP